MLARYYLLFSMNKALSITLMVFGIIFLVLLVLGIFAIAVIKPFGNQAHTGTPTNTTVTTKTDAGTTTTTTATSASGGFALSASQKSALTTFGIDPAKLPCLHRQPNECTNHRWHQNVSNLCLDLLMCL